MEIRRDEGTAIARLVGGRSNLTVGWIYLWNTFELGVLWLRRDLAPQRAAPWTPKSLLKLSNDIRN